MGVDFLTALRWPFFGEIQAGKLAEQLDRFAVVGPGRLDLVIEIAEAMNSALESAF